MREHGWYTCIPVRFHRMLKVLLRQVHVCLKKHLSRINSVITLYTPEQATIVFDPFGPYSSRLYGLFVHHTPQTNKGECSANKR